MNNPSNTPAVRLTDVSKVYRLYQKPAYRLMDLFGLCPQGWPYYSEHQALANVTATIGVGEKVAIIGRNGAGKSTLLKIIAGLLQPSSGDVAVNGKISNLLQLGTGFHPEFTGRQNVFASLAHQGIIGREASTLFDRIVDFAEIEEYIDQPMKTYSTGMCSRLMFSSSIVMNPQILIVDELLGVGDAYFSHKSFARMRDLCAEAGTTLLLVTHDIYSALNLCDRFIWIDRGQMQFDGSGKDAIQLYEKSIREQEEEWQRRRSESSLRETKGERFVHVVLRSRSGFALSRPVAVSQLELIGAQGESLRQTVADGDPRWHLVPESNLGAAETIAGERARALQVFGSVYHKAEWTVALPETFEPRSLRVRWHYRGSDAVELRVVTSERKTLIDAELPSGDGWQEHTFKALAKNQPTLDPFKQVDYGNGIVRMTSVEFLDAGGQTTAQVRVGDPLTVRVHCHPVAPVPQSAVTFVIGFTRQGTAAPLYIYTPRMAVPDADFVVDARLERVEFGAGTWFVNLGIGEPELMNRHSSPYFSLDNAWHHLKSARLPLQVVSASKFDSSGCYYALPTNLSVYRDESAGSTPAATVNVTKA